VALPTVCRLAAWRFWAGIDCQVVFAFHAERPIRLKSGPAAVAMIAMMFERRDM